MIPFDFCICLRSAFLSRCSMYAFPDTKSYYQDGRTALNLAERSGRRDIVTLLSDNNANMEGAAMVSQSVFIASAYCISLYVLQHWT